MINFLEAIYLLLDRKGFGCSCDANIIMMPHLPPFPGHDIHVDTGVVKPSFVILYNRSIYVLQKCLTLITNYAIKSTLK